MSRSLLFAVVGVIAVIVISWMLGELLRQRKK
jgi:ABC-type cobalt transport system substrate-binding protein